MHQLIAAPFLEQHVLVRPGSRGGALLPEARYEELRALDPAELAPAWLAEAVATQWDDLDLQDQFVGEFLLVRQPSTWGYGKASWEVNLGCNYACKHCYLGMKVNSGMPWEDKRRCLDIMAEAGVLFLQVSGGEPTIDRDFMRAYRYAWELGMMITVSTNGSLLWRENLLRLFSECPPYRVTVSMYGASKASYDGLTQRDGAWDQFVQGMNVARHARLPLRMSIVVTEDNGAEEQAMVGLCESWGVEYAVFTNMMPTIYGGAEVLTAQSKEHLRLRKTFTGCNAGHTFFHLDPHGLVSICKIGRDDQISLPPHEGIEGLARLGCDRRPSDASHRRLRRMRALRVLPRVQARGWLEPVMTVPYVPTLGPVRRDDPLHDLFEAVVENAGNGRFLPHDKDARWFDRKAERVLADAIEHDQHQTLIPTLNEGGPHTVKVHVYGDVPGSLTAGADLARKLAAAHGAGRAKVAWFLGPDQPEEYAHGLGTRVQFKDFAEGPGQAPVVRVLDYKQLPESERFAVFADLMAGDGFAFLYERMQAGTVGPVLTILDGATVAGAIGPMETMSDAAGRARLLPQYFGVRPEYRGLGYGRALWRAAMHWGHQHGAAYQLLQTEVGGVSDRLCAAEGLTSLGFVNQTAA